MASFIRFSASLSCLFIFFCLLSHQTMSQPQHLRTFCEEVSNNFTENSSYKSNRETLLSSLRDRSSLGTYSNATVGVSPDTVYGMFLCRGDITKTSCSDCVKTATLEITKNNCTYKKNAITYYEECMVRYSNVSFFGLVEDGYIAKYSLASFSNSVFLTFRETLSKKVEQLIILTASKSSLSSVTPYYMRDISSQIALEGSYTLDTMVQCSPDLDPENCGVCLRLVVQGVLNCCNNARWAHIFLPKCFLRYNTTGAPQSGSSSVNVIQGKEIIGSIFITTMTTLVLALMGI